MQVYRDYVEDAKEKDEARATEADVEKKAKETDETLAPKVEL